MDEANCILHSTNTIEKGMNTMILPPATGKLLGRLVRQPMQEKANFEYKPIKLNLKKDLEGLENTYSTEKNESCFAS